MTKLIELGKSILKTSRSEEFVRETQGIKDVFFVKIAPAADVASIQDNVKGTALELIVCFGFTSNANEYEPRWREARELGFDEFPGIVDLALGHVLTDGLRYTMLLASIVNLPDDLCAELAAKVRLEVGVGLASKHYRYTVFPRLPNESVECCVNLVRSGAIWFAN